MVAEDIRNALVGKNSIVGQCGLDIRGPYPLRWLWDSDSAEEVSNRGIPDVVGVDWTTHLISQLSRTGGTLIDHYESGMSRCTLAAVPAMYSLFREEQIS